MKYIDEYRDQVLIEKIAKELHHFSNRSYTFMEVCGGHTMAIRKFGLTSLLPGNFRLRSGPGCPVCVTCKSFIDKAVACARQGAVVAIFGDLMRIPGTVSSLEKARIDGADVRIVFSPVDAVEMAARDPRRQFVFAAAGFETTAPGTACAVKSAEAAGLDNFFVLSAHKVMPPAMRMLVQQGVLTDGFICPGHVCAVTGSAIFDFIPQDFGLACVVSGFEPVDILYSILMLTRQITHSEPRVEIQYRRAVTCMGNLLAQKEMDDVFCLEDTYWRGLGKIPLSGLRLRDNFSRFDAERAFLIRIEENVPDDGCLCGEILKGMAEPADCPLFRTVCHPGQPAGACMVSPEGACNVHFNYGTDG